VIIDVASKGLADERIQDKCDRYGCFYADDRCFHCRTNRFCFFIAAMVLRIILPGRPYNDITDMDVRWPRHNIVNRIGNIIHFRDRTEFIFHGLDHPIWISGNRLEAAEHKTGFDKGNPDALNMTFILPNGQGC